MTAKGNATKVTDDKLIGYYMDYVLENEVIPQSVYKFCKEKKVKEEEFYAHFGSFDSLRTHIWNKFFSNTIKLLESNEEYEAFSNKDKMLTFFFTFFELLTLNRSYVLFSLEGQRNAMDKLKELRGLRSHIKNFATELIDEANAGKNLRITKRSPKVFSEGAWIQLLFLLKFWMDDSSAGFEKTDLAIEKSVTSIFDVFENTPLESLLDFGKFLYKENFA
ncbi:TetR family transcriptional regulator C-terminal domain-containing protein [Flavobacteriaceae bacterium GF1]